MDLPQRIAGVPQGVEHPSAECCPRCAAPWDRLPAVEVHALGVPIRRCTRCGARATTGTSDRHWVFNCNRCGLPFSDRRPLTQTEQRCPECRGADRQPADPEPELTVATEAEFRAALAESWSFVGAPALEAYLDRLLRRVATRVPGAPASGRVAVVEDWRVRCLALPSGTVLLSVGALSFLEDEAELVFVLAHELAHVASGDAAARLAALGFHSISSAEGVPGHGAWVRAAEDLMRMGYGRQRERDADARAIGAVLGMRYDPASVLQLLERLRDGLERGEAGLVELATSHPVPADRARRVERAIRLDGGASTVRRVNREVYRRVAGRRVLEDELRRARLDGATKEDDGRGPLRRALVRAAWAALGVGGITLVILLVGWLLSR